LEGSALVRCRRPTDYERDDYITLATKILVFNNTLLDLTSSIATHIDLALLALLALDMVFLAIAELLARMVR